MHSSARLERGNLVDAIVRFYRLIPMLKSTNPDIVNAVVIRMVTTLEQVGRYLWKTYLEGRPNDESIEIVIPIGRFDSVRHMSASELVAYSKNISNTDDLRSILDKCGLGGILDKKTAADVDAVTGQRNGVVHGAEDADIDIVYMHGSIGDLIRRALSRDGHAQLRVCVAKASVAETLEGDPLHAAECHEEVLVQCGRVKGGDQAFVFYSKGNSLAFLDRDAEALEAFDRAIGIDPLYAEAHAGRGDALAALDREAEALEAYGAAIEIDRGYPPAYFGKGTVLHWMDRNAEALEAFDRAIGIDRGYPPAYFGKGTVLHWMDRNAEALEAFDRAIGIDPLYAEAHAGRGDALAALGREAEAHAARDTASRLSSDRDRA